MPRSVCAALLASSALWTTPAAADPLCYAVAFTEALSGLSPVQVCVPYPDAVLCEPTAAGAPGIAGVIVLICVPLV